MTLVRHRPHTRRRSRSAPPAAQTPRCGPHLLYSITCAHLLDNKSWRRSSLIPLFLDDSAAPSGHRPHVRPREGRGPGREAGEGSRDVSQSLGGSSGLWVHSYVLSPGHGLLISSSPGGHGGPDPPPLAAMLSILCRGSPSFL